MTQIDELIAAFQAIADDLDARLDVLLDEATA